MMSKHKLKGTAGRLLRVNLTEKKVYRQDLDPQLFIDFLGARGLGAKILYQELLPGTGPLGPENKLIFMTGPLEGTLAPGANKITVTFKSPLTGTCSVANCGGHLAVELKFAGYDGIVVEGKSKDPVYLLIRDDEVKIKGAPHLWGKTTHDTDKTIRKELDNEDLEIACIGPAGESLVRFACIQADYHREFGRGGAGAVMGAKNLKAIAVRGTGYVEVEDANMLEEITKKTYRILAEHPKAKIRRLYGTPEMVDTINSLGFWATRNFSEGVFEKADKINGTAMREKVVVADRSCFSCPVACGKISSVEKGPYAGTIIEGAEFETLTLLGPNCGIGDIEAIVKAASMCDLYGMDTITTGNAVGFAMECYERGIIDKDDTQGIELKFGNVEGYLQMIEKIAKREGFGDLLGEGVRKASRKLGAEDLGMHVKGLELPAYDPRGVKGLALNYATAARGGCHMKGITVGPEVSGSNRLLTQGKARLVKQTQQIMAIIDSLAVCSSMRFALDIEDILRLFSAVTGLELGKDSAMKVAERILNTERLFNVREGFDRKDDTLPKRFLSEPMPGGPGQGQTVELSQMLDEYYKLMGWDKEGKPTPKKLKELDLSAGR